MKIKVIDAMLPNDYILRWERLSQRGGKVQLFNGLNEMIRDQWND